MATTPRERALRRARQRRAYRRRKARIHAYLGGVCHDCGAGRKAFLEVDHVRLALKRGDVLRLWSRRWSVLVVHLDLCVLRCHRCHADRTTAQRRRGWVDEETEAPPF